MPIYEYRCTECEHRFDKLQRMADDPLKNCPECNKPALKKLVSAAAFKLTGSGWYETDFKNNSKPSSSEKTKDSSGKSADLKVSDKKTPNKVEQSKTVAKPSSK